MALILLPGLIALAVVAMIGVVFFGVLVKVAVRLILLPLLLIKWIVMGIVMLVVGPILFAIAVLVFLTAGVAVAVPLLPLLAVGAIVWLLFVRPNRRPAVI